METIVYVLLMLIAGMELYISIFVLNYAKLIPFTGLALALAILMLLIRIFYLEKKITGYPNKGPQIKKTVSNLGLLLVIGMWIAVSSCAHQPKESRRASTAAYKKNTPTPTYWRSYDRPYGYRWWW